MEIAFELLLATAMVGALDVLYFHLYRFRLFEREDSVVEELTHLIRAGLFLFIAGVVMFSDGSATARYAILAAFAFDLVNNAVDVLVEKRSRATLGGLPSVEYLVHILSTFLTGVIVATFWWQSSASGFAPVELTTSQLVRGGGALFIGSSLLFIELGLFVRAVMARRRSGQLTFSHGG